MKKLMIIATALLIWFVSLAAPAEIRFEKYRLKNGLRVILSQNHSAPNVAIVVYYDVGSRNEEKGKTGFAHLFEHMMFQGSKNFKKTEHFKLIKKNGGYLNGYTSADKTVYFNVLPSDKLELGLKLEADRMKSLEVTQPNFVNQRDVVKEEMKQSYLNQPYAVSYLEIFALAYHCFEYGHSTIGEVKDLDHASISDVLRFHRRYYIPNNAVLSVTGDLDVSKAKALIEKYFGEIPAGRTPPRLNIVEPLQKKEKKKKILDPLIQLPAFHLVFHTSPRRTADYYPLRLLEVILLSGKSSRLFKQLLEEKHLVVDIRGGVDGRRGPDLFRFFAITNTDPKIVVKEIFQALENLKTQPVAETELQKAKNLFKAGKIFNLQKNIDRAQTLALYYLYDDNPALINSEISRYLSVTRADIQQVAKKYFTRENATLLFVYPKQQRGVK